ncbi:hypothetical protein PAXINDRAFT_137714 [Paxillus involutus ATCC 200175]|uniref:HMG box domain-containing protein n=1 Tax=Paxillus involutus ATCC 200175 TaxID=664439 RepID=A0A0C9ST16_PAXIN|nr:hypothetical protein PAXINDRAFT_137714 [Paxillus involutus ATCC 200175]
MPALRTRDTFSQSLEVITDTIQPPSLAIISPTPRAFTFPFNKTNSSPYSSPISSPFEPDLRQLTLTPSQPTLFRTLSPVSPSGSSCTSSTSVFPASAFTSSSSTFPASPSTSHKRRKSSICSDIERRPKKGDDDYIKRPENAFILFRRKCCEERQALQEEAAVAVSTDGPTKKQRQADLSKTISQQWKALSPEERLYWEELAKEKKKEHEHMYPNYVYRPQRTKDRKGKKGKRGDETDSETNISFMLPLSAPMVTKNHGRSASAPTPPPARQTIQIPSVYMPSCPTSPSLLPMISRRASHPDHGSNSCSQFDFVASSPAMPQQQYSQPEMFPGVDANGFYHGMFENLAAPHPLSIPSDMPMLHAQHQMVSPVSSIGSGSGHSSPTSGPFTPVHCGPEDFSFPVAPCDQLSSQVEGGPLCGAPLDNIHFGYSDYSWEGAGAWESHSQMLAGDEFDMSAIPPIELGIPGCGEELTPTGTESASFNIRYTPGSYDPSAMEVGQYPADSQSQDTFEQLFNFESMLAAHHGY